MSARLVYDATGVEVKPGDIVSLRDGNATVVSIELLRHAGSTGRVYVREVGIREGKAGYTSGYFPGVINAHWVGRTDQ